MTGYFWTKVEQVSEGNNFQALHSDDGLVKVLFEVCLYPVDLSVDDFDKVIAIYQSMGPPDAAMLFRISEFPAWSRVSEPGLTRSGRRARDLRRHHPFFEPVRNRILQNRAFVARLWDGRELPDPEGSWSLNINCEKYVETGRHHYIRALFPISTSPEVLVKFAQRVTALVDVYSGHGGPVFAFDPVLPYSSFTRIYAMARRFQGIDIDFLDRSLIKMRESLNPPCWMNIIGNRIDLPHQASAFSDGGPIHREELRASTMFLLGNAPAVLDKNRMGDAIGPYHSFYQAIADQILTADHIGLLPGDGFTENATATQSWLDRFAPPKTVN